MAIFTAIATFLLAGTFLAGTIAVPILAAGLGLATTIGLSYVQKALAGTPDTPGTVVDHFSVQTTVQAGGDVPRSFNIGYSVTAGSRLYINQWGLDGQTPNAYLTDVIALWDLPGASLARVWVNNQLCTLDAAGAHPDYGVPVVEYRKDGKDHVWIKYYDGTQTTADAFLVSIVSSADRPYQNTRVGVGCGYVICTSLIDDTLFTGVPTFRFETNGVPLYDPSKDSTNDGSGSHRWSDRSTWGGDGDNLPAVQAYNILRGITFNGQWLYGLQGMTSARLPAINWITQIAKCRATISGEAGPEPTYRSGGQINVSAQIKNTLETIMTGCQGALSEVGGAYKVHLGAPDSPSFSFSDDDILSTEEQNFAPFFGLGDSINGIAGTWPDPSQGWAQDTAPPYYVPAFEAQDGNRRLLANPSFDFVPYAAQVQRLQRSAVEDARRERRHTLVLPPHYWTVEPGDVGEWTSVRNGYDAKQFTVTGSADKDNLDNLFNLREVDPTDYDWDHDADFQPVTSGATTFPRPAPQGIVDWSAEPWIIKDDDGLNRRPAIRLSWDGDMPGVVGVQFEVRGTDDQVVIHRGRTDQLEVGAIIISQSLLPDMDYQARGQYLPSAPRDMLWSDWLDVTTPNVLLSLAEFDAAVTKQVTAVIDSINDQMAALDQRLSTLTSKLAAQGWTDIKSVRSQLSAVAGNALAQIEDIRTVAVDADSAVADLQTAVTAEFDNVNATVTEHTTAIATLDDYAAGTWGVVIDVNGNVVGLALSNGSDGFSVFSVTVDNFKVAFPGVAGGDAVDVFAISNYDGVPKIVWKADMVGDGSLTTQMIAAGAITTVKLDAQAVTAAKIAAGTVTASQMATGTITSASGVIGALGVTSLSLGDNAVTVPVVQTAVNPTTLSFNLSINTAGLAGKTITVYASASMAAVFDVFFATATSADLFINGSRAFLETGFGSLTVAGAASFTASGGTDVIPVRCNFTGSPTSGTLFAMAAKR